MTLWFACRHPATPWYAKAIGIFVVGCALSPIDLIPDFVPVLGYLDDVLLLPGLIWLALRLTPQAVLAECRQRAQEEARTAAAGPRSLVGGLVVVAVRVGAGGAFWHWVVSRWLGA